MTGLSDGVLEGPLDGEMEGPGLGLDVETDVGAGLGASDGALLGLCEVNWLVGIDVGSAPITRLTPFDGDEEGSLIRLFDGD